VPNEGRKSSVAHDERSTISRRRPDGAESTSAVALSELNIFVGTHPLFSRVAATSAALDRSQVMSCRPGAWAEVGADSATPGPAEQPQAQPARGPRQRARTASGRVIFAADMRGSSHQWSLILNMMMRRFPPTVQTFPAIRRGRRDVGRAMLARLDLLAGPGCGHRRARVPRGPRRTVLSPGPRQTERSCPRMLRGQNLP